MTRRGPEPELTTVEVAALLGITPSALRSRIWRGTFPPADRWVNGHTPVWRASTIPLPTRKAPK